MKPEQITRLTELEQALVDVFAAEADPSKWPKKNPEARYRAKRNAAATLQLARGVQVLLRAVSGGDGDHPPPAERPPAESTTPEGGTLDPRAAIAREAASLERAARSMLRKHGQKPH